MHHRHVVGVAGHQAQVVADQQNAQIALALQAPQQIQDGFLDGHVQGGGGLVGDQQGRVVGQRHGDHHPLTLAAAELMRVALQHVLGGGQLHLFQQIQATLPDGGASQALMNAHRLADLPLHAVQRVERGERLLKDGADTAAAQRPAAIGGPVQDVVAVQLDGGGTAPGAARQ